jgi:hypothetical protein
MKKLISLLLVLGFAIVPFEEGLAATGEGNYILTESSSDGASYEDSRLINSMILKGYLQIEEFNQQFTNWIQQENAFYSQKRAFVKQRDIERERMNIIQYSMFYFNSINQERDILDRWSTIVNQRKNSLNQFMEVSIRRLKLLEEYELSESEKNLIKVFNIRTMIALDSVYYCGRGLRNDYKRLVSMERESYSGFFTIAFISTAAIGAVGMFVYELYDLYKLNKKLYKLRENKAKARLKNYSLWMKVCGWILHKDNGE